MGREDGRGPLQGAGCGARCARRGDSPHLSQARQAAAPRRQSRQPRLGGIEQGRQLAGGVGSRGGSRDQPRVVALHPKQDLPHAGGGPFGGRGGGRSEEDFNFGDIFSDLFGRGRAGDAGGPFAARGRDVRYTLEIDFLEAATGAKKRVTLPDGGVLDLAVPEGVADGQTLRLKGKGSPGLRGSEAGDALVEIRVRPHPHFKRTGDDIALDLPITVDEAVLGAKIEVPTVSGRVQLSMPKGTSSGRVFRLKGKGVRNTTTGNTGDQLVTVRIVLPDTIDDKLAYFMSEWRQSHRYDPGRS